MDVHTSCTLVVPLLASCCLRRHRSRGPGQVAAGFSPLACLNGLGLRVLGTETWTLCA